MDWRTQKFIQLVFQGYYRTNPDKVDIPEKLNMREFGIESFQHSWLCNRRKTERKWVLSRHSLTERMEIGCGERGSEFTRFSKCPKCGTSGLQWNNWTRHLGFGSPKELLQTLVDSPPHSIYHSAAFYQVPVAKSMDEKGWQAAELIFDIDADHLDSQCTNRHDHWVCKTPGCQGRGTGKPPEEGCPVCNGTSFSTVKWLCDRCLGDAKANTIRLYDEFLVKDLGIKPDFIRLNYSGHRGYHVRVNDPEISKLDSGSRVELVHFITGMGMSPERVISERGNSIAIPDRNVPGWAGKTADALLEFIRSIDSYDGKERWVESLRDERARKFATEGLERDPPILSPMVKGIGLKFWQEIVARATDGSGAAIDEPVTYDIHRVIRLPGSLNGKTGFAVSKLTRDEIDDFDPFRDSIAVEGNRKIRVPQSASGVPSFRIGDETYGPYNDESMTLPLAAALFLLCKGVATVE